MSVTRIWLLAYSAFGVALAGEPAGFSGRVVMEVLDDIELVQKLKLIEDFSFTDAAGRTWRAPRGGVIDGETIPRELSRLESLPHAAELRRSSVVHDYQSREKTHSWRAVHRMLYEAAIAEGVVQTQAKILYAAVYAGGWRWETRDSTCYRSCHIAAQSLAWKPKVALREIEPLLPWILLESPALDAIDQRVDAALRRPGPHIFAQPP